MPLMIPDQFISPACQLFGLGIRGVGMRTVADTGDRDSAADRALNPVVRLHVGLENVEALVEDFRRGVAAADAG